MRPPERSKASWNVTSPSLARMHRRKKAESCILPVRRKLLMMLKTLQLLKKVRSGSLSAPLRDSPNVFCSSSGVKVHTKAQTMAPTEEPPMTRGSTLARTSARTTPKWNAPRVAPPLSTSAERPKQCRVSCRNASFSSGGMSCSSTTVRSEVCTSFTYSFTTRGTPQCGSSWSRLPMLVTLPKPRSKSARSANMQSLTSPDSRCSRSNRSRSSTSSLS
mmetsp:Transcript_18413/g.59905  ORF Transcript_18413/g.59905 Transcript_18413/m.59905 type:complete len:218 (-) Transcript_18413:267-920(-)